MTDTNAPSPHRVSNRRPASLTLPSDRDILVCIFQRGAADGLNSVVPWADPNYALQRPTIAVPPPGQANGAIDLDGFFGFAPALAPLKPLYDAGNLAVVHATGMPHGSRSHFAAQGLVERGVLNISGESTGWLGRHLSRLTPAANSAFRVVALSSNVPVALQGVADPLAISNVGSFSFDAGVIEAGYPGVLANLYQGGAPFGGPASAALVALDELQAANLSAITPANGAVYPASALGGKLRQVGQLIRSALPVEVICLDADSWDHHERLPQFLPQALGEMAASLAAFTTDMGGQMSRITVLVYTEFGRRVKENGSAGTDHGTAGVAYLIGGGVNGGQVVADWPGLADSDLEMGDDLRITTDLRAVITEMLDKRVGGVDAGSVFPGFSGPVSVNLFAA